MHPAHPRRALGTPNVDGKERGHVGEPLARGPEGRGERKPRGGSAAPCEYRALLAYRPTRSCRQKPVSSYPDDLERYGVAGRAWCEHDSRYLLAWGLEDARAGTVDCVEQVQWLGRVLANRAFPIERLARHVELTVAVTRSSGLGEVGDRAAARMSQAAAALIETHPAELTP
jgi:hypothetical protein